MADPEKRQRMSPKRLAAAVLVGVPLWGLAGWYFFVDAGGSRALVNAYVTAAKSGAATQPLEPDGDSDEARALVAKSKSWSLRNWIRTSGDSGGTGCVWTRVTADDGRETDLAYFVVERDGRWQVARVSAHKECHCLKHEACRMDR